MKPAGFEGAGKAALWGLKTDLPKPRNSLQEVIFRGSLIDFDGAIDLSNEPVTGEKANGTREEEHENCHNYRVTKVQNGRCRTLEG